MANFAAESKFLELLRRSQGDKVGLFRCGVRDLGGRFITLDHRRSLGMAVDSFCRSAGPTSAFATRSHRGQGWIGI